MGDFDSIVYCALCGAAEFDEAAALEQGWIVWSDGVCCVECSVDNCECDAGPVSECAVHGDRVQRAS